MYIYIYIYIIHKQSEHIQDACVYILIHTFLSTHIFVHVVERMLPPTVDVYAGTWKYSYSHATDMAHASK